MVVSEHEKQRLVQAGNDKIKVIQRKVPGREYQFHPGKTFPDGRRVNQRINLIGNAEDFQGDLLCTILSEKPKAIKGRTGAGMNAIITVVGNDKVGIIARVSAFLAECNINIEDISQTILSGNFVMMMMVDLSSSSKELEEVKRDLAGLGETMNVSISLMHEKVFSAMHRI